MSDSSTGTNELAPGDLGPQTVARTALGAAMAAFATWARDRTDLTSELDRAFRLLASGFTEDGGGQSNV